MSAKRKLLIVLCIGLGASVTFALLGVWAKYNRSVVIRDLSVASTSTVSVGFQPHAIAWKMSGRVQGTGTVYVPWLFSNTVTGSFSTNGGGDYYLTNLSVTFTPEGEASGKIRISFFFNDLF